MDPGASDHSAVVELDPVRSTPREGLILGPAGGLLIPESGRSLDMMPESELRVDLGPSPPLARPTLDGLRLGPCRVGCEVLVSLYCTRIFIDHSSHAWHA